MARTSGRPEIAIGLIDGPVALDHPDLAADKIREVSGKLPAKCSNADDAACTHGTFIAGILLATRASIAPAIAPGCNLLIRPVFAEAPANEDRMPSAAAADLADAIVGVIDAGARVINLSVALQSPSRSGGRSLQEALDFALRRGIVVVAAAGNQGAVGGSVLTRHPWVIPVIAYDLRGRPMNLSNLGASIGRCGLGAPGEAVTSLGVTEPLTSGGTSAATPFVTGAVALIWSEFPAATAAEVRSALTLAAAPRRTSIVPPLLNAWASYQAMSRARS
ncbi:S8 family peptidase [Paraburkholderia sp. MM6662-R1]|uniref:S8 family peptidase n=1 Tax=Paraburkholderia sp. MM6662-R1 TaxID=2991066 RepID=UPI003D23B0B3